MANVKQSGNGVVYLTKMQVKLLNKGRKIHIKRKGLNVQLQVYVNRVDIKALQAQIEKLQKKLKKAEVV